MSALWCTPSGGSLWHQWHRYTVKPYFSLFFLLDAPKMWCFSSQSARPHKKQLCSACIMLFTRPRAFQPCQLGGCQRFYSDRFTVLHEVVYEPRHLASVVCAASVIAPDSNVIAIGFKIHLLGYPPCAEHFPCCAQYSPTFSRTPSGYSKTRLQSSQISICSSFLSSEPNRQKNVRAHFILEYQRRHGRTDKKAVSLSRFKHSDEISRVDSYHEV